MAPVQHGKAPSGFSFTLGDSDPRGQGSRRVEVLPISCALLDGRSLREEAIARSDRAVPKSDEGWRSKASGPDQRVAALAAEIRATCEPLLGELNVARTGGERAATTTYGSGIRIEVVPAEEVAKEKAAVSTTPAPAPAPAPQPASSDDTVALAACRTEVERYSGGAGAEHDNGCSIGQRCYGGGEMMVGSIPTRFSTLQHRHPTDVPRHRHQRPLPSYGLEPAQQKLPEPHPRLDDAEDWLDGLLALPIRRAPVRVFCRCRIRSTASAGSQSGGGSMKRSCQGR